MNTEQKYIANLAIDRWCKDSTARQIVRYVMECELWGQDSINPTNAYLAQKYGWTINTVETAIKLAKKSQFITTTGARKTRRFELNVGFLKGKMAEIVAQKPLKNTTFDDVLPPQLPPNLPPLVPPVEPPLAKQEYGLGTQQKNQNYGDNNKNKNKNIGEQVREVSSPSSEDTQKPALVIPSPYSVESTREHWMYSPPRLQILDWFFQEKDLWKIATTRAKLQALMRRHSKVAERLEKDGWTFGEIKRARAKFSDNESLESEWTLETVEKYLTK